MTPSATNDPGSRATPSLPRDGRNGLPPRGTHARAERRHWGRRIAVGFLTVVLIVAGGTVVALKSLQRNIHTEDLTPLLGNDRPSVSANPDGDRPVNILIMGSDSRAGDNDFIGGKVTAPNSDTTLVLHLAADRSRAVAVSIPRDSLVQIPDCVATGSGTGTASSTATAGSTAGDTTTADGTAGGRATAGSTGAAVGSTVPGSRRMFNNAFQTGGPACTIRTVESLTGLRIDHWVVVDFNGFKDIVDALGTVPICLAEPVDDAQHHIHLPAGRSRVNGTTALAYVRERYKIGDGSDLGRIRRQQAFLASVLQEATSAGTLANPAKAYSVLRAVTSSLTMDRDLDSVSQLTSFGQDLERIGLSKIQFLTVPTGPAPDDPNRLVWTAQATSLWTALREDRPVQVTKAGSSRSATRTRTPKTSGTTTPSGGSPSPGAGSSSTPSSGTGSPTTSPSPSSVVLEGVEARSAATDICAS